MRLRGSVVKTYPKSAAGDLGLPEGLKGVETAKCMGEGPIQVQMAGIGLVPFDAL